MDIGLARDIIIVIAGIVFILTLVGVAIVVLNINRRLKAIAASANQAVAKLQVAAEDLQVITGYPRQEVALPLAQLAGLIQGLGQGLQSFTQMFKKW